MSDRVEVAMARLNVTREMAARIVARDVEACEAAVGIHEARFSMCGSACTSDGRGCQHLRRLWDAKSYRELAQAKAPTTNAYPCECRGSGKYYSGGAVVNGTYTGTVGKCYRCGGKGWQNDADRKREFVLRQPRTPDSRRLARKEPRQMDGKQADGKWYIAPPPGKMRWPDNLGDRGGRAGTRSAEQAKRLSPDDLDAAMRRISPAMATTPRTAAQANAQRSLEGRTAAVMAKREARAKTAAKAARRALKKRGS